MPSKSNLENISEDIQSVRFFKNLILLLVIIFITILVFIIPQQGALRNPRSHPHLPLPQELIVLPVVILSNAISNVSFAPQ